MSCYRLNHVQEIRKIFHPTQQIVLLSVSSTYTLSPFQLHCFPINGLKYFKLFNGNVSGHILLVIISFLLTRKVEIRSVENCPLKTMSRLPLSDAYFILQLNPPKSVILYFDKPTMQLKIYNIIRTFGTNGSAI